MIDAKTDEAVKPVVIYDAFVDGLRPVTQADVDRLLEVYKAYGEIRQNLATIHRELSSKLDTSSCATR